MYVAETFFYNLKFINPSGTSRGILHDRPSWFIKIYYQDNPSIYGIGECGPIKGLSIDSIDKINNKLVELKENINDIKKVNLKQFPSIVFGLESALIDLKNGGKRILFNNGFSKGKKEIKINGLIWMGEPSFMIQQIKEKIDLGFSCLKLKIGALNFNQELEIIKQIRKKFSDKNLELRVDANGSFKAKDALVKLKELSKYKMHSIEQPIEINQLKELKELCKLSPIAIALDEELIKIRNDEEKKELIEYVMPHYLILKPSLLGGFKQTKKWIDIAEQKKIKWWITSALESNIGLNAIAQFCAEFKINLPQGLGTGNLFNNNFPSPLSLNGEMLSYNNDKNWDLKHLFES
tara:strand:+ start:837 stop:1886 length:1050 start_codon:yes stop_codon:yes gene_type:complete